MGERPPDGARPPENNDELIEFLEHAPVGLCWVDAGGRMLWTNGAGSELFGCSEQECVGHSFAGFFVEPRAVADILGRLEPRRR
jgi:PAS domain S-box-containing protein